jgi:hypothetical protein
LPFANVVRFVESLLRSDGLCLLLAHGLAKGHPGAPSVGFMATALQVEPPEPPLRCRMRRWWVLGLSVVTLLGVLAWPATSYIRALTYPGQASFLVRTVEWVCDNGGGGVVDLLESWWYAQPPSGAAPSTSSLPSPAVAASGARAPAPIPVARGLTALRGEGRWVAGRAGADGSPVVFTTFERPDVQHPSIVAGVASIDAGATRLRLVAGTTQPDHTSPARSAQVPPDARGGLVATFNSGFKMADANGGFRADGHSVGTLRRGAASVVIRADGSATVGQWGRDIAGGPDVVAVRQNLDLVVDNGRAVDALADNAGDRWGTTKNQVQYTWRSGMGVDAAGNLLYVGGANLNLETLAHALVQAGAVRGMQLDIHSEMVAFLTYPVGAAHAVNGVKLLPDMPGSLDRYLVPDQRDFFAVTLR